MGSPPKRTRNRKIAERRLEGETYESLGERFGISWQRARVIVLEEAERDPGLARALRERGLIPGG